jgi:uncharacterized membrane protein
MCLAAAGLAIATYLALYQVGLVANVWEPFFGEGSKRVLHSSLSRLLPVPDAAFGAFGYALEVITGAIGGGERWRTMPWAPIVLGLIAMGMALGSLALVLCQPLLAHTWCTLCLCSAAISFLIAGLAFPEFTSALSSIRLQRAQRRRLWFTKASRF